MNIAIIQFNLFFATLKYPDYREPLRVHIRFFCSKEIKIKSKKKLKSAQCRNAHGLRTVISAQTVQKTKSFFHLTLSPFLELL